MHTQPARRLRWIGAAFAAALLLLGTFVLRHPPARPELPAEQAPSAQEAGVPAADIAAATTAPVAGVTRPSAVVSQTAVRPAAEAGDKAGMLRIQGDAVLATVNGTPIALKDLLPLPPGKERAEHVLLAERYAFLLERAVDREIVFQQARAAGLDLTESQRGQLARLRARSERPAANLFDDLQHHPGNTEFEARDATALLLQASLAEEAGVPPREVTAAQVEQYYRDHPAEFSALPSDPARRQGAWEGIDRDIRVKLARQQQALHEEGFDKFTEQLRASAQIVTIHPHL